MTIPPKRNRRTALIAVHDVGVVRIHAWRGGDEPDYVETEWPDGRRCGATRDATDENLPHAAEQGYPATPDGLWESLLVHEIAHTVIGRDLWPDRLSAPLRHEAGDRRPLWARYYEESVVLAFQGWTHTGARYIPLDRWWHELPRWLAAVGRARRTLERP